MKIKYTEITYTNTKYQKNNFETPKPLYRLYSRVSKYRVSVLLENLHSPWRLQRKYLENALLLEILFHSYDILVPKVIGSDMSIISCSKEALRIHLHLRQVRTSTFQPLSHYHL